MILISIHLSILNSLNSLFHHFTFSLCWVNSKTFLLSKQKWLILNRAQERVNTTLKVHPITFRYWISTVVNDDYEENFSETEEEEVEEAAQNGIVAQVLEGVDVLPLVLNSDGAAEASSLGYSSKLVSNWYKHTCAYDSCQARWSEFAVVDDDEADL